VEDADIQSCTVKRVKLVQCEVVQASIDAVSARGLKATSLSLDGARFNRVSLKDVVIDHADCTGLIINGVNVGDLLAARRRPRKSGGVSLRRPV